MDQFDKKLFWKNNLNLLIRWSSNIANLFVLFGHYPSTETYFFIKKKQILS